MKSQDQQPPRRRRGILLMETVVAGLLLMAAMVLTVQMLGWVASERRDAERRQWASQQAANVMERLTAWPWSELTEENVKSIDLDPDTSRFLPDARLVIAITPSMLDADKTASSPITLKRITVEIRWPGRQGREEIPSRLTAWVTKTGRRP